VTLKRKPVRPTPRLAGSIPVSIIFLGLAEGALSAANRLDSANPTVGGKSVPGNRMDWLENYCRDHALELFVNAAFSLRAYLQQQNE
jgi:hypothetical protein